MPQIFYFPPNESLLLSEKTILDGVAEIEVKAIGLPEGEIPSLEIVSPEGKVTVLEVSFNEGVAVLSLPLDEKGTWKVKGANRPSNTLRVSAS